MWVHDVAQCVAGCGIVCGSVLQVVVLCCSMMQDDTANITTQPHLGT